MNGWFPKINSLGEIASGNAGIWLTYPDGKSIKVSDHGTSPFWIGNKLCYNRNDGTTQVGEERIGIAYNNYYGSEQENWTGFIASGIGKVDFYTGSERNNSAEGICLAKYSGEHLVYVAPYQNEFRTLVYDNIAIFQGKVMDYVLSPAALIAWQIAISTYGRQILNQGDVLSIREDETPRVAFEYLGQSWLMSQTNIGTILYPFLNYYGYYLPGDLYYSDARILGNKLLVVGSDSSGRLLKHWIDFMQPRVNLKEIK